MVRKIFISKNKWIDIVAKIEMDLTCCSTTVPPDLFSSLQRHNQ